MSESEQRVRVPGAAKLEHGKAIRFEYGSPNERLPGFVLRVERPSPALVAFANRCAHVSFDLDMGTGEFWSEKSERIYCMTHGARFRVLDGVCDYGPCEGDRLEQFALEIDGDDAVVTIPPGAIRRSRR